MNNLILQALRGEATARRPLWIMRQAGRYLPEYRELRSKYSFSELVRSAELATEITLMPLRRFPFDAAIVFADIMSPIASMGVEFDFDPGPVVFSPVRTASQIDALRRPSTAEIAPEVATALRNLRTELPAQTALLGFCGAPWTLAAYLVEGRGAKDFPQLRRFAAEQPELLDVLLGKLTDVMSDYLLAQYTAGADAIQIFDSWAGLLSQHQWRRVIRPHLLALLQRLGAAGVPRILFLQNAPHLVDCYAELPAEVIATDWRVDLAALQRRYPDKAVQGNLDPALLLAGAEVTRSAGRSLLQQVSARGHIMNLGHGILPNTPLESVQALVDLVHEEAGTTTC
jgi:uroporphyrinogen decarboxylase